MALTEGTQNNYRPSNRPPKSVPLVADGVVFKGGLVMGLSSGYNDAATTDTPAGARIRGIALESASNTGGSSGDVSILIDNGGAEVKVLTDTQVEQEDIGDAVNVLDDNTIYMSGAGATAVLAGNLSEYQSGTAFGTNEVWIRLKPEGVAS